MNRIAVFGTGIYCKKFIRHILKKDIVVCFVDNDASKHGVSWEGVPVIAPNELFKVEFDFVAIFVAKKNAIRIKDQLLDLGVPPKKILLYDEYISSRLAGVCEVYNPYAVESKRKESVAMVSFSIVNYGGGTMAAVNLVRAVRESGRKVSLIVPSADSAILDELCGYGFEIIVYPAFCNVTKIELGWIKSHFDYAIVNGFPFVDLAYKISSVVPCSLWIHEPNDIYYKFYESTFAQFPQYKDGAWLSRVNVLAVSSIAKRAFLEYFPGRECSLFPYGISDEGTVYKKSFNESKGNCKITFAIIGRVEQLKAQDIFLKAYPNHCDFLIIGKAGNDDYAKSVLERAESLPFVVVMGALSRAQIAEAYKNDIDVVVCPSFEETMSLVITEGMMNSKICIVSDNTGMAEYITDGKNGFVCKAGDENSLYEKMIHIIESYDELGDMRLAARKTYEENFTFDVFGKRFNEVIGGL